jgi:putative polyhydroxyalkanoate system protein
MSTIVIQRKHALGLARARGLAETVARQLQHDYGGSYLWSGDDLHFQRTGASGSVAVTKEGFQVRVELGVLLSVLRSRIEREIVTFCDEHFGESERPGRGQPTRRPGRRGKGAKS